MRSASALFAFVLMAAAFSVLFQQLTHNWLYGILIGVLLSAILTPPLIKAGTKRKPT